MYFCEQLAHRLCREDAVKILAVFFFFFRLVHLPCECEEHLLDATGPPALHLFLLGVIHVLLPVSVWVFLCDSKLTLGVNLNVCVCLCLLAMSWRLVLGVPSVFPLMESVPNRDPAKGWRNRWWIDATPLGLSDLAKASRWHIQRSTVHVLVWETCQRSAHSTGRFKKHIIK